MISALLAAQAIVLMILCLLIRTLSLEISKMTERLEELEQATAPDPESPS